MATTIVTKSGSGAPTASDLVAGELAVDLTNKRLYTEDSGGTVLELGTNPSGNVTFGDNGKAIFGAASDLQIYHDGFNSYIKDTGTGDLRIWADSPNISTASGNKIFFGNNGSAELYTSGGALRLATTATGIDVTGNISLPDNGKATFGASDDLQIYHDGSHSYIKDAGTGQLRLLAGTNVQIWNADATNLAANFNGDTQTSLYYAGSSKLSTTASGIDVTGTVTAEALGIGGSPIAALDVTGTDAVGSLTSLADTVTRAAAIVRGSTHANGYGLYMGYGNASTDAQYIQSTLKTGAQAYPLLLNPYGGNVGISTSSPQKALHVNSGTSNIGLRVESSDATASIEFIDSGTTSTATSARVGGISDDFFVQTNGSERLRIDASGHAIIPAGVTLGTAAGVYNAAKTLEDYEEGTFTPVLAGSSTAGSFTYTTQNGVYTKIGNIVIASANVKVASVSTSAAGFARLTGGPFTSNGTATSSSATTATVAFANSYVSAAMRSSGSTEVIFYDVGTAGLTTLDASLIVANSVFRVTVVYYTG